MLLLFPVCIKSTRRRPTVLAKLFDGLIEYSHNVTGIIMVTGALFINYYY